MTDSVKKRHRWWLWLAVLLVVLAAAYWIARPWWRLPFDRMSPLAAVIETQGILIGLPASATFNESCKARAWETESQQLEALLAELTAPQAVKWKRWWLVPQRGNAGTVFTFIGEATEGLSKAWGQMAKGPIIPHAIRPIYRQAQHADSSLYFTRYHNLLIAGKLPLQLETALSAIDRGNNWLQVDDLATAFNGNSTADTDWTLAWQGTRAASSWPALWPEEPQWAELTKEVAWTLIDIFPADSTCHWEGFWRASTTENQIDQEELSARWDVVPEIVEWAGLSLPNLSSPSKEWTSYIAPWAGTGIVRGELPTATSEVAGNGSFWLVPVQDTAICREKLAQLSGEAGLTDRADYQTYTLQQVLQPDLLQPLTTRRGVNPWWVILEDVVVFAVSRNVLERFVDYHIIGGSLGRNAAFLEMEAAKQTAGNGLEYYRRWSGEGNAWGQVLGQLFPNATWRLAGQLRQWTTPAAGRNSRLSGTLRYEEPAARGVALQWDINLPANGPITLLPVQQDSRGVNTAVIAQDTSGQYWVLGEDGRTRWRGRSSTIFSPAYLLEWPGEGTCLLFSTDQGIELWTSEGQRLDPFPILPQAPDDAPAVVDFGGVGQQVIFQAVKGGNIYGLKTDGQLLGNWNPLPFEGKLRAPLQHYQQPRTDFLVGLTQAGELLAWNRLGELHFDLSLDSQAIVSTLFGQQLDTTGLPLRNRLVVGLDDGRAKVVSFAGEHFYLPFGRGPADRFLFSNYWGDERGDYLVQRGGLVHLWAYEGEEFAERWQYRQDSSLDTLIDAPGRGIIGLSQPNGQLFLIDGTGQPVIGFPVAGEDTAIPLLENGQTKWIITKVGNRVYGYQL